MQHRDIAVAGAFGAGIGTVLAIVFSQYIVLGTLGGALAGALIGGMSFRPLEVARVAWSVLRENWRGLAWSAWALTTLASIVALWVQYPQRMAYIATAMVGALLGINGWRHRAAVIRAVSWFVGKALAVVWVAGTIAVGATALPLAAAWVTGDPNPEPFGTGIILFMLSMVLIMVPWLGFGTWRLAEAGRPRWQWALIGWFVRLIGLGAEPSSDGDTPLVPPMWGNLQIGGRYVRRREICQLGRKTWDLFLLSATIPLMVIGLALAVIIDIPVTIALALASSKRIAVMEGAFLGVTLGAVAFRAGALPPVAVLIASAVGAASGVGLYRLRKRLDCTAPATA